MASPLAPVPAARADDATVVLRDVSFVPSIVEVDVGDTVTWTHQDGNVPHSVTSSSGPSSFDSHPACTPPGTPLTCMTEGDPDFSVTFEQAGTWEYHCKVHPSMTGVVVVETEPTTTTSSSSTTTTTAAAPAATEPTEPPPPETTEPEAASPLEPGEPPPGGDEPAPGEAEDAAPADDASDSSSPVLLALALLLVVAVGSGLLWRFRPRRLAAETPVEAIVVDDGP